MTPMNRRIIPFRKCQALHAALPVLAIMALAGCDTGYNIDTSANKVVWVTRDEGSGRREWPVDGADAITFEVMEIYMEDGSQQFGRDQNHVYFVD